MLVKFFLIFKNIYHCFKYCGFLKNYETNLFYSNHTVDFLQNSYLFIPVDAGRIYFFFIAAIYFIPKSSETDVAIKFYAPIKYCGCRRDDTDDWMKKFDCSPFMPSFKLTDNRDNEHRKGNSWNQRSNNSNTEIHLRIFLWKINRVYFDFSNLREVCFSSNFIFLRG